MDPEMAMTQISEILNELAEDTSVPRNIDEAHRKQPQNGFLIAQNPSM